MIFKKKVLSYKTRAILPLCFFAFFFSKKREKFNLKSLFNFFEKNKNIFVVENCFFSKIHVNITILEKILNSYSRTSMIIVNRWARLGNSIVQLRNVLHIALYYKCKIKLVNHKFFDIENIKNRINNNNLNDSLSLSDKNNFFNVNHIKKIKKRTFNANNKNVLSVLLSSFMIKDIKKLDYDTLVIHIRSGDIFKKKPHHLYIMPPLSYYVHILENTYFDKVILLAEDRKNPVINRLLDLYPDIIYNKQTLEDDIKTILGATHIVSSFGTFLPQLLILSKYIRNYYKPSYSGKPPSKYSKHITIHDINLEKYKSKLTPWKNTKEQRNIMLNYKL